MFTRIALFAVVSLAWFAESARAQQVIVQQPQVQVFGVDTAVSVPDGGAVVLGGVSSGAWGRQTYGPLPWGTAWGQSYSTSVSTAHVWIHDMRAMDQAVLAAAAERRRVEAGSELRRTGDSRPPGRASSPAVQRQAASAMQQLLGPRRPR